MDAERLGRLKALVKSGCNYPYADRDTEIESYLGAAEAYVLEYTGRQWGEADRCDTLMESAVAAQASWSFSNSSGMMPGGSQRAVSLDALLSPITILGEGGDA